MTKADKSRELIALIDSKKFVGLKPYKIGTAFGGHISAGLGATSWRSSFFALLCGWIFRGFEIEYSGTGPLLFIYSPSYTKVELHKQNLCKIANIIPNSRTLIGQPRRPKLDTKGFFTVFYFPLWLLQMLRLPFNFKQKLFLIGQLGQCKNWLSLFLDEINRTKPTLVTLYSDSRMYENITAQCCRGKCIPTATLQHGMYSEPTVNSFSGFELFVSDTLLAWGEYTKECAIRSKIAPERIYKAGLMGVVEKVAEIPDLPVFGVMLSGAVEHAEQINTELIVVANEVANKFNLRYIVRPHPGEEYPYPLPYQEKLMEYVCDDNTSLQQLANSVRFFISPSTSTVAFDLIHMGAVSFMHNNSYENFFSSCFGKLNFKSICDIIALVRWSSEFRGEYETEAAIIDKYVFTSNEKQSYQLFFENYL